MILDVKRGDIASTGAAYGRAAFGGAPGFAAPVAGLAADALTASPYLGDDSLEPLVAHCADGKGVFVLTRTSNPGAALLQEQEVEGRPTVPARRRAGRQAGRRAHRRRGLQRRGRGGRARRRRRRCAWFARPCRSAFLLVPGYGAQGAGADALAGVAAGDAAGFVVNASRSIIYAWQTEADDYRRAAAAAAESMRNDLAFAL